MGRDETRAAWLLALGAAAVFAILATPKLAAQGAYYDELHQAPAAFTYVTGVLPPFFNAQTLFGLPALNLSYVGALKSAVVGIYLATTGQPFDLATWRLFGIAFVAAGLAASVRLAYPTLRFWGSLTFAALFLSDAMVLLGSRHDWGPIALALALRSTLVGVWLAGEGAATTPLPRNTLAIGVLVGIALFEKQTNVALVPALLPLLLRRVRRDPFPHVRALLLGGAIGAMPLVAVNVASYLHTHRLVSLPELAPWLGAPLPMIEQLRRASSVGLGCEVGGFILGMVPPLCGAWQLVPAGALLVVGCLCARWAGRPRAFSHAIALLAAYAIVLAATDFLPRTTWVHHWVMATPFQYAGLAAAVAGIVPDTRSSHPLPPLLARLLVAGAVLALLGVQIVDLASVERGVRSGWAGVSFDPSLNRLGAFVARRAPDARFIATDWGVGTQLLAFASGAPGVVEEVFWEDGGDVRITAIANAAGERDLYFVAMRPPLNGAVSRDVVERVQERIARFPCFDDLPLEPELTDLAAASVRRVRVRPGCLDELRSTGGGRTSDQ